MRILKLSSSVCSMGSTVVNDLSVSFKVSHTCLERCLPGCSPDVSPGYRVGGGGPVARGWAVPALYFLVSVEVLSDKHLLR